MTTTELQHTELRCMCDLRLLCQRFSDFGKREREPGESLGSLVILAERENAWRITRKHLRELEKKWAGWQGAA